MIDENCQVQERWNPARCMRYETVPDTGGEMKPCQLQQRWNSPGAGEMKICQVKKRWKLPSPHDRWDPVKYKTDDETMPGAGVIKTVQVRDTWDTVRCRTDKPPSATKHTIIRFLWVNAKFSKLYKCHISLISIVHDIVFHIERKIKLLLFWIFFTSPNKSLIAHKKPLWAPYPISAWQSH